MTDELRLNPERVIDALPALVETLGIFNDQTSRLVRHLDEAQRGDPHRYLSHGIDEGLNAARIARRTVNELDAIIARVRQSVQAMQEHDRSAQAMPFCVAPSAPNSVSVSGSSSDTLPPIDDVIDNDDYGTEQLSPHDEGFIDWALGQDARRQLQERWTFVSFFIDVALSFFVIGDLIDFVYQSYLMLTGQEVDELTAAFAALGLAADLGWLQPVPSAEDAPNIILAVLKPIVKRLPKGKVRDRLAELIKKAAHDPDELRRLNDICGKLSQRVDLIPKLADNPKVLMAVLEGGPEFVDLLLKYGDDAFQATNVLGKNAPAILKQYDKIASMPGADRLLKDLSAGGETTREAVRRLRLVAELKDNDVKFSLDKIERIERLPDNRIVFLEKGDDKSGLQHIVNRHKGDFEKQDINESQIPDVIMEALQRGERVGTQRDGEIYRIAINGKTRHILIVVGKNGYIVTAYPVTP